MTVKKILKKSNLWENAEPVIDQLYCAAKEEKVKTLDGEEMQTVRGSYAVYQGNDVFVDFGDGVSSPSDVSEEFSKAIFISEE